MSDRSHLSIGEVLSLLQDEFPDVTISKIRFLESQGLLDPERTPSGYRKFYDADIDRLRWILRQQRENFLPLKVIKDRLETVPFDELLAAEQAGTNGDGRLFDDDGVEHTEADRGDAVPTATEPTATEPGDDVADGNETAMGDLTPTTEVVSPDTAPAGEATLPAPPQPPPAPPTEPATEPSVFDTGETTVSMSPEELSRATGLSSRQIGELERFGLIVPDTYAGTTYYGPDALVVARMAAAFFRHGVEPRHLRMYKVAAEREAGFLEQVIMPLLKQRNPKGRRQAIELLDELVSLGDHLRSAMLRQALRDYLERG